MKRSFVVLALGVLGCRNVIGIDELVVDDGGATDAGAADTGRADAPPNDPRDCSSRSNRDACVSCCKDLGPPWDALVLAFREGCICGPAANSVCGPSCGGKRECEGSPINDNPPALGCLPCIAQAVTGSDPRCVQRASACAAGTSCRVALDCIRGCPQ